MDKLYENIKKLRKEKHMSQERLAEMVGYTDRSSIAKIENGLVDLPQSKIVDIARALNTTPGALMDDPVTIEDGNIKLDMADDKIKTIKRLMYYSQLMSQKKMNSLVKYAEFLSKEDDYDD